MKTSLQPSARSITNLPAHIFGPPFYDDPHFSRSNLGPYNRIDIISRPCAEAWHEVPDASSQPQSKVYMLVLANAHIWNLLALDRLGTSLGGEIAEHTLDPKIDFQESNSVLQQPDNKPIRVVIVDDHPFVSAGIQALLNVQAGISVVGVAQTGSAALQIVREQQPTVLLLDLRLPDISGFIVAAQVRKEWPQIAILVHTAYEAQSLSILGIQGYFPKTATGEEIIATIHAVAQEQSVLSSQIHHLKQENILSKLTKREILVLQLLLTGRRNHEIADILYVTVKTVEYHLKRIFKKMGVRSRAEAISKALSEDLISLEE